MIELQAQKQTYWRFIEAASLIAYAATFVMALGWATRRSYLAYFGVDHSGIDEASADININYIGFGLRSIINVTELALDSPIFMLSFIAGVIALYFVEMISVLFYGGHGWLRKFPWKELSFFVLIALGSLLFFAIKVGDVVGAKIAEEELSDPFSYYRPVSLLLADNASEEKAALTATNVRGEQRFGLGRGCWMKLLMDKKNIYLFLIPPDDSYAVSNAGRTAKSSRKSAEISEPPITVVRLDQVKQLDILPSQKQKRCPLVPQSD